MNKSTTPPSPNALNSFELDQRPLKKQRQTLTKTTAGTVSSCCCTIGTIRAMNENGNVALKRGDLAEAEHFYTQSLAWLDLLCSQKPSDACLIKQKQHVPALARETISDGTMLAQAQSTAHAAAAERNRYDEGMDIFQLPESIDTSCVRPESIIARLRFNIGLVLLAQDKVDKAVVALEHALHEIKRSGLKDPEFEFRLLHKIGFSRFILGRITDALSSFEQASSLALEAHLNKASLAACLNCLGVLHFHHKPEKADTAMQLLKQSLVVYREVQSCLSKEVATVLNNIGRVHFLLSEYKQALTVYAEALVIRVPVLGKHSIDVAATLYNTGQCYHQIGQLDSAMQFYKRFLSLSGEGLGSNSRDAAIVYRGIGEIHLGKGEMKLALKAYEDALSVQKMSLGKYHLEVASTLNKLGNLCYEMQDHSCALRFYAEGLEIENTILEPNHSHIIITLTNIAHIEKQRRNYSSALGAYLKVFEKQQKAGADDITMAVTLSSIGLVQYHLKNYAPSFESYQEALRLRRDHFGTDDTLDIASTLNSIGLVLFKQSMFDLARSCFSQSLRIRTKLLGNDHRDVAILWYNLATIHFETGDDDIAIKMYKETLRVECTALGPVHSDVVLTLQHIGQVLQQVGKLEEALTYFHQALVVEKRLKKDHVSIAKILNLIGNIQLQEGLVEQMMQSFTEASRMLERCGNTREALVIAGYNFYGLAKTNPKCASAA